MMVRAVEPYFAGRFRAPAPRHLLFGASAYKAQFEPMEFFNGFRWSRDLEELASPRAHRAGRPAPAGDAGVPGVPAGTADAPARQRNVVVPACAVERGRRRRPAPRSRERGVVQHARRGDHEVALVASLRPPSRAASGRPRSGSA